MKSIDMFKSGGFWAAVVMLAIGMLLLISYSSEIIYTGNYIRIIGACLVCVGVVVVIGAIITAFQRTEERIERLEEEIEGLKKK